MQGNYPLETSIEELLRLRLQSEAMAPEARLMLELIGVNTGWCCLDIGCGPSGISNLLSSLVGSAGKVLGIDRNPAFLIHARKDAPANVTFELADAYQTGLPSNSFDLVHMRFLASTAGNPELLLKEAIRVARPGGTIALQEPDGSTLNCHPPHASWLTLKRALLASFEGVGADLTLASRLPSIASSSGLVNIEERTFLLTVKASDPIVDYLPSTVESLRGTVLGLGLLTASDLELALRQCRRHLTEPGTTFTMYTVAQVWGKKPAETAKKEKLASC